MVPLRLMHQTCTAELILLNLLLYKTGLVSNLLWMLIVKTLAQTDFATIIAHQLDHFKDKTQQERLSGCTLLICAYPKL